MQKIPPERVQLEYMIRRFLLTTRLTDGTSLVNVRYRKRED
jgi:hypothetical protein